MSRTAQFALGAIAGGLTTVLWFATEFVLPWEERLRLLVLPGATLGGLVVLGSLRKEFAAALGYLLGISPAVAVHALVLVGLAGLLGLQSVHDFSERVQRRPFESSVWRTHDSDRTRARMVDDLVQSRRLSGLTVSEVHVLLGPPSNNRGGSDCDLSYWLGTNRGWLCLSAEQGRISKVLLREYDD